MPRKLKPDLLVLAASLSLSGRYAFQGRLAAVGLSWEFILGRERLSDIVGKVAELEGQATDQDIKDGLQRIRDDLRG